MQKKLDCVIGKNYPKPVVDVRISAMKAKKKIFEVKKTKKSKTTIQRSLSYAWK